MLLVALALAAAPVASSSTLEDVTEEASGHELFVGVNFGAGYSMVNHPELRSSFMAPTLSIVAGVFLSEQFTLGLEVQNTAKWVERKRDGIAGNDDPFTAGVSCTSCKAPGVGGELAAITATFSSIGPRLDFAPWGRNGLFVGLGAGVATIQGLPTLASIGFAASGHAGVRYRLLRIVELAIEFGVYGQRYSDSSITTPYASAAGRLHF